MHGGPIEQVKTEDGKAVTSCIPPEGSGESGPKPTGLRWKPTDNPDWNCLVGLTTVKEGLAEVDCWGTTGIECT